MSELIFISHASADRDVAERIAAALAPLGLGPWLDRHEIEPGQSFVERIGDALERASYVLLLLSPAAAASRWVKREWMAALAQASSVLIPVRVGDVDPPPLLRDLHHVDMTIDPEGGLRELVAFFARELGQVPELPGLRAASTLAGLTRRQLRLVAMRCMDELALQSFCHDCEIEPGSLPGSSLHERIVALLHRASSEDLTTHFATWLEWERRRCVRHQVTVLSDQPGWELEARRP